MLSIGDSLFPEKFPYKSEWFAGIRDQESFSQRSAVLPPQAYVLPLYAASSAAYNYFWTFRDFPALLYGYTLHRFPQCRKPSSFHESDLRKYAGSYPQIFLYVQYTFLLYLKRLLVCKKVFFGCIKSTSESGAKNRKGYRGIWGTETDRSHLSSG